MSTSKKTRVARVNPDVQTPQSAWPANWKPPVERSASQKRKDTIDNKRLVADYLKQQKAATLNQKKGPSKACREEVWPGDVRVGERIRAVDPGWHDATQETYLNPWYVFSHGPIFFHRFLRKKTIAWILRGYLSEFPLSAHQRDLLVAKALDTDKRLHRIYV